MRRLFHSGGVEQSRGRLRKFGRFLAPLAFVLVLLLVTSPTTGAEVSRSPAAAIPTPTDTPIAAQEQDAVAYQINPAHTGATTSATLYPPLVKRWSVNLGGTASYPIIAQGKVFVTVIPTDGYNPSLYVLDAASGQMVWGPREVSTNGGFAALAYDAGNLFVYSDAGMLQSLDASTGVVHWTAQFPSGWGSHGTPVASQGIVYVVEASYAGTLFAVDEQSGHPIWSRPLYGINSSPALSDNSVFVTFDPPFCRYAFNRWTGQPRWSSSPTTCGLSPGLTSAYYQGRLYTRSLASGAKVYDAETGNYIASYLADPIPALANGYGFTLTSISTPSPQLSAVNLATGVTRWTFSGDDGLDSAPIVVNQQVYIGSSTDNLYALDAGSGRVIQTLNLGVPVPVPDEEGPNLTGLNAGDGLLVVPTYQQLFAFGGTLPSGQATPVSRKGR